MMLNLQEIVVLYQLSILIKDGIKIVEQLANDFKAGKKGYLDRVLFGDGGLSFFILY